jgi:hypothetical protein
MAVILTVTATPSSFASGDFPLSTLQDGPAYRLTITPDFISSNGVYSGFQALLATNDNGGLYLADRVVVLAHGAGSGTIVVESSQLTWSATQPITITVNIAVGANASSLVVSGAATGNGTTSFTTEGTYFTASTLGVGQFTNSNTFLFDGEIGDIDDVAGLSRTVALEVAVDGAAAATGLLGRTAAVNVAVGAATEATVPGSNSADLSIAVGAAASATRALERSVGASVAAGAVTAASVAGGFGPGVSTSGIWTFGHSAVECTIPGGYLPGGTGPDMDGRTPTQINTEASGSTFYVVVARPVATVDKTVTDNKGNTYTSLLTEDYGGAFAWESEILVCVDGTGGTDHEITADGLINDELTFGFDEIKQCAYLADFGTVFIASGETQISPIGVDLKGPGWVYVDWLGNGPTDGAEGAVWTVTAQDEGSTVGSQWQVVDARITNHTDGWIQWKRWRRFYAAATTDIRLQLASLAPVQGARWYAAAFMEANVTDSEVALTVAVGATTAAAHTRERAAALSVAIGAAATASASHERTAAIAVAVDAAAAASRSSPRSAVVSVAAGATAAAVVARERSASAAVAIGAAAAAASSGPTDRTAELPVEVGASTSASRILVRSAAAAIAASASVGAGDADPALAAQNAIFSWVLAGSGLADGQVMWGRVSAKNGPMPAGTFISMRITSTGQVSNDWLRTREADGAIEHSIEGTRHPTLEISCFAGEPSGADTAANILGRVLASIKLPSVAAGLRAAGVGVGRRERVRVVDRTRSGMLDPMALVEVGLHLGFAMVDPVAGSSIETVEVTNEITGDEFTVERP